MARGDPDLGEGRGLRGEWPEGRSRWARGQGPGPRARGEGRGARGEGAGAQACSSARSFHSVREARHAEQVASAEPVACLLYWFLGHAVWLPGDCAVAIVSVVRTGMARSSLECWLFILSAVAWPEVGVRSESR